MNISTMSALSVDMSNMNFSEHTNLTAYDNTTGISNLTTAAPEAAMGVLPWQDIKDRFGVTQTIITPVLLFLGLFGNSMTIATLSSKAFESMTSRYILIALAISDTTLLLTQPFNKLFVRKMIGYDARALTDVGCKAFFHIFKTGKMTSSWLIVILCFERFVAVVFPLKTKAIITKKNILTLIIIDYIFIGIFNAVWTFSSLIVDGVCKPDVTTPDTKILYRDFLIAGSSFYSLIPMIVMAILTPIIVFNLLRQKKRRSRMQSSQSSSKADSDTVRISAMLIGVVAAYITLVFPITLVHNLAFYKNVSAFDTNTLDFFVLREMAQILEQMNYSTNFILYVLCSKKFRDRMFEILCCTPCCGRERGHSRRSQKTGSTGLKTNPSNTDSSEKADREQKSGTAVPALEMKQEISNKVMKTEAVNHHCNAHVSQEVPKDVQVG